MSKCSYKETLEDGIWAVDRLLCSFGCKRVGKHHELVDDHEWDTETSAESEYLLADSVTEGNGAIGLLVHDLSHRSIGDDIAGALNNLAVEITNKTGVNI